LAPIGRRIRPRCLVRIEIVEKPDAATAERYLQDPAYSWNAGIFVFRADAMLDALRRHLPKVHEGLTRGRDFAALQSISIDYGVMEPESQTTHRIALVPGDFGWSDLGSWDEVRRMLDSWRGGR